MGYKARWWFIYIYIYYTGEYTRESIELVHIRRGEISQGRCICQGREDIFYEKTLFCLFYIMFVFLFFFMVFWVTFSIYSLFFSSHHVYVLDMLSSLYYCAFLLACSNDHLVYYVIIVVIFVWLSSVWSSCSYVSHYVYLIAFYLLLYTSPLLLALPWGSNMFCTSISEYRYFIPSLSQVLDLGVSKFWQYFQTHI